MDCDDIYSYGPEHVTIHTTTDEPYYYYVNNFSAERALAYSGACVTIQQGNNVIADFNVPTDFENGEYWNVFAIKDGSIIVSNTITYEPDITYAD